MDSTTFGGLSFVVAACRLLSRAGRADDVYSINIYDAARDAGPSVYANLPASGSSVDASV